MRSGLVAHIEREIEHEQAEPGSGLIMWKVNSIVDEQTIDALYRASRAGVRVSLWVRGICAIRPGVEDLSETVEVRSVLGRFLEHSRVFYFGNAGDPVAYIGSADMMHRNLDRRVEALVRITEPGHVEDLRSLLDRGASDEYSHWALTGGRPVDPAPPRRRGPTPARPAERPHRDARQAPSQGPPALTSGSLLP